MNQPVLILGGGINGAAAARELILNGTSVWLVDTADLAYGATAYSSRLVHGGLRYLEFADFALVKESLQERGHLLRLASHWVKPLRLYIPVRNTWGGMLQAAVKFTGLPLHFRGFAHRGLCVVGMGLWLYNRFATSDDLPRHSLHRLDEPEVPRVNPRIARRLWAYSDAQITWPERLVIALVEDARALAASKGIDFQVLTYHQATLHGDRVEIRSVHRDSMPAIPLHPAAIINATGAWVDHALARLPAPSRRLVGGTRGSHFLTYHRRLRELLGPSGVYTEARDGRPVFVLPLGEATLVGTTDIPFEGDPASVVATEEELDYLLDVTHQVFPEASLTRQDIVMHQCGVRPLPFANAKTPAKITRRHQLVWNDQSKVPLVSLVGGKLTTARSLAEETAAAVLRRLGREPSASSLDRPIPPLPVDEMLAAGDRASGTIAAWSCQHEWVTRLEDLVERRLMLHFAPGISRVTLVELAATLVQYGKLDPADVPSAVDRCADRLRTHFGIRLTDA